LVTLKLIIAEREDRLVLIIYQNGFKFYQFFEKIDRKLRNPIIMVVHQPSR